MSIANQKVSRQIAALRNTPRPLFAAPTSIGTRSQIRVVHTIIRLAAIAAHDFGAAILGQFALERITSQTGWIGLRGVNFTLAVVAVAGGICRRRQYG